MKNLILETIIYEVLKKEPKISSNELLTKTKVIYNHEAGEDFKLQEYNEVMSKLGRYRYIQKYNPCRE